MITLTTTQDLTQDQADMLNAIAGVTVTLPRTVECDNEQAEESADLRLEALNIEIQ